MKEYKGLHKVTIDSKGRLSLPAPFRRAIKPDGSSYFEVVNAFRLPEQKFLFAASPVNLSEAIDGLPGSGLGDAFAFAHDFQPDNDGRFVMPIAFRSEVFQGEQELVFVGTGKKFEIWGAQSFEAEDKTRFEAAVDGLNAALS